MHAANATGTIPPKLLSATLRSSISTLSSLTQEFRYKPAAFPWYLFLHRQGCMSKLVSESLGRCLLAFADLPAIDHHVPLVRAAVDSQGAEGKFVEVHTRLRTVALRRSSSR